MAAKRTAGYHHGDLRQALIEAGVELIQEQGARALTLRGIGARVGVSRMAAYRHFADKGALLGAICEAGFVRFADALEGARKKAPRNFASRMAEMGLAYGRFAAAHPAHYEAMFRPDGPTAGGDAPASEAGARAFGVLEQTIRDGQAAGEVREGNSTLLARIVWAMVHGLATLRLETDLSAKGAGTKLLLAASEVLLTGLEAKQRAPRKAAR